MASSHVDPESLYRQLAAHISSAPNLASAELTSDTRRWLGRAFALVEACGDIVDSAKFRTAWEQLGTQVWQSDSAATIRDILERALARAELRAPAAAQGAFIPVGASFDAFRVIGKILAEATNDALVIDPYLDGQALIEFGPLVAEGVRLRLLSDSHYVKTRSTLKAAATKWAKQYINARPLEARVTPPKDLHDRLIIVDGKSAWSLTQSLKDFAARSPASAMKVDEGIALLKIEAYEKIWGQSDQL